MAVLTGNAGELRWKGTKVAKCRNFSIDISRDALETTALGEYDRSYVEGLRGATGSATVLYDATDGGTTGLLNDIFSNETSSKSVSFVLNTASNKLFSCEAVLTGVSTPVSVGEVIACSVNFQISGPINGTF